MSEIYWPKKIDIQEVGSNALWSFISGLIWSCILAIMIFLIGSAFELPSFSGKASAIEVETWFILPVMLSVLAMLILSITAFSTYKILTMMSPERFNETSIHKKQIAGFLVLTYIMMTFLYLILGSKWADFIIWVYIAHIFVVLFWLNLILEVLNNYRYVLVSVYWNLLALIFTAWFISFLYSVSSPWTAKILIILLALPVANTLMSAVKDWFLLLYYKYFKSTWRDPIGDIFHQIKEEEEEELRMNIESNI